LSSSLQVLFGQITYLVVRLLGSFGKVQWMHDGRHPVSGFQTYGGCVMQKCHIPFSSSFTRRVSICFVSLVTTWSPGHSWTQLDLDTAGHSWSWTQLVLDTAGPGHSWTWTQLDTAGHSWTQLDLDTAGHSWTWKWDGRRGRVFKNGSGQIFGWCQIGYTPRFSARVHLLNLRDSRFYGAKSICV